MRKILFVTDAWRPQVNGVVTMLEKTKTLLEKKGYVVELIEPGQFHTVPLPLYPEIRLALFPARKVDALIRDVAPDSIHIATEGPLGLAARRACIRRGLRFTTSYHTHYDLYTEARFAIFMKPVSRLLRWFHSVAVRTLVSTDSLKQELEKRGFKNLTVCPLGVDTDFFIRKNGRPPIELEKPVFVYFGRIAKEKSPEDFLRLSLPGTKLVIGDGPDRKALEAEYGNKALFVGYKRGTELIDWLSLADVLVFPSRTETFGLVILEALSCGIPVAAHDVMGPKDIITNGKDGFLEGNLTKAALACLALDPAECRKTALRYSWEASARAFETSLVPVAGESGILKESFL